MTIQCDHFTEARRPVIVVVEEESNKAIIVVIASPWDHRVYEKEVKRLRNTKIWRGRWENPWGIRLVEVVPVVVGALGAVSKRLDTWLDKLGITIKTGFLQKKALLGTARILRKALES